MAVTARAGMGRRAFGHRRRRRRQEARSHSPATIETLEEVEKRIGVGTIKWICFQVLKEAGPHGLLLSEM